MPHRSQPECRPAAQAVLAQAMPDLLRREHRAHAQAVPVRPYPIPPPNGGPALCAVGRVAAQVPAHNVRGAAVLATVQMAGGGQATKPEKLSCPPLSSVHPVQADCPST
eukprot:354906-Chlamydomonas_euryale.AAC.3